MTGLLECAKAARLLGEELKLEAENGATMPLNVELLHCLGDAHIAASVRMVAQANAEFAEITGEAVAA